MTAKAGQAPRQSYPLSADCPETMKILSGARPGDTFALNGTDGSITIGILGADGVIRWGSSP